MWIIIIVMRAALKVGGLKWTILITSLKPLLRPPLKSKTLRQRVCGWHEYICAIKGRKVLLIIVHCLCNILALHNTGRVDREWEKKNQHLHARQGVHRRACGSAHTIYFNYARRVLAKYITIHGQSAQFLNMLGWRNFTFACGVCIIGFVWESASQISKSAVETETESC